jgi:hypothetical protein
MEDKVIVLKDSSKTLPWVIVIIFAVFGVVGYFYHVNTLNEKNETYERQMKGYLSESERKLQQMNVELGLAKSELMEQKELSEDYAKQLIEKDEEFEKLKEQHRLQLRSYEIAIAELKSTIEGGDTEVVVTRKDGVTRDKIKCPDIKEYNISYKYSDRDKRVSLYDPNIFVKDNEKLVLDQKFRIVGEIWQQKDGLLKTKRLELKEVVLDGEEFREVAKAKIVDFKFNYTAETPIRENVLPWYKEHLDYLTPIGMICYNISEGVKAGLGVELLHLKKIGLGLITNVEVGTEWDLAGMSAGIAYRIPGMNIGASTNIGTSFSDLFDSYTIGGSFIFYVW